MKIHTNFAGGGLSACGKSTVGEEILLALNRDYPPADDEPPWQIVDLGDIARARAEELGLGIEDEAANRPSQVDLAIEEACRVAFRRGHSIVLGRLPWMVGSEPEFDESVFRFWIDASPKTRAWRRYWQTGRGPQPEVLRLLGERDESDTRRYTSVYADRRLEFPPREPFRLLDLVVSAETLQQPEIARRVIECSQCMKLRGPDAFLKVQLN